MMARRSGDTWKSDSLPVPAGSDDSAESRQALAARALSGMFGAPAAPERKSSESEARPPQLIFHAGFGIAGVQDFVLRFTPAGKATFDALVPD